MVFLRGHLRLLRAIVPAAVVAASFAWAAPAAAATITVDSSAQSPGAVGDCTLGEAIEAANTDSAVDGCAAGSGDDVISLSATTFTLSAVDHVSADGAVALPEIESTITIDGANPSETILQRSSAPDTPVFMLFHMDVSTENQCWPSCTLTLLDVGVQNAVGSGGAVTNRAGRTVINNVILSGNTSGPAVWATGPLVVADSFVTNNSSTGNGGVFHAVGDVRISGTEASNNMTTGGDGGVLYFGTGSTATVTGTDFGQNSAVAGGSLSGAGTLEVSGSTFTGNSTLGGSGGAIGGVTGTVRVTDSVFQDNGASAMEGGAIASNGVLEVTASTFEENTSDIGGAISARGSSVALRNSTFWANGANVQGGALFARGGAATISNSTFAENFGVSGGGFSWEANGGTMALRNSLIATNSGFGGVDCVSDSEIVSQGYNLVGDATGCMLTAGTGDQFGSEGAAIDPLLGALDGHGGTTRSFSLLAGSPALDMGNPMSPGTGGTTCEQLDQRAQVRPRDGDEDGTFRCDIGSWEGGIGHPVVTVTKDGTGTGLVEATIGGGISCGSDCVEPYPAGTSITLVATPTADSEFIGWQGCNSVAGDQCNVSVLLDRSVVAVFKDTESILSVTRTGSGQGSVTSDLAGIECGFDCDQLYPNPTTVVLTATPASNSNFHFWSGCDSTNGLTCTVDLESDRSVFASFSPIVRTLSLVKSGTGNGTVTSDPAGIDCGGECSYAYQIGTPVTLTAVSAEGSEFGAWSGCDTVEGSTCTVEVNEHQGVTASFTPIQRALTVTKSGSSPGTITSEPAGIDCPDDCFQNYDDGTSVVLTGNPGANVEVTGWTGCDSVDANVCTVQMGSATEVSATFAPTRHSVTITKGGTGSGSVSSAPAGVDCGSDCSETYDYGTTVVLTAAPDDNMELTGWSGCDSSESDTCTVTVDGDEAVEATFRPLQRSLSVSRDGAGAGSVSSAPGGIACGSDCTQDYDHGTSVVLTATPDTNNQVAGWAGCDSVEGNECTVAMTGARNVTATFTLVKRTLDVTTAGTGTGSVSSAPAGIDCGLDCTQDYDHGTSVVLTATPAVDSALESWSGCDSVDGTECTVTMDGAASVTATFTKDPRTLTITRPGAGTGDVSSSPIGIDCGDICSEAFDVGASVTLTATPDANSDLAGWSGCDSSTATSCTVTMSSNREVTATFDLTQRTLLVQAGRVEGDTAAVGSVTSDTGGIDCAVPNDCSPTFTHGSSVVLTAVPGPNDEFSGWTGCAVPDGNTCTVMMDADKTVGAKFHNTSIPSSSITSLVGPTRSTASVYSYEADPGSGTSLTAIELWVNGPGPEAAVKKAENLDGELTGEFEAVTFDEGDGSYEIMTRARNSSGNYETGTTRNVVLDTNAPDSNVTTDAAGNQNAFDLAWTNNEDEDLTGVAEMELWVDGPGSDGWSRVTTTASGENSSGSFSFTAAEGSGSYAFYSIAQDGAGNREDAPTTPDVVVQVSLCPGYEADPRIHLVGSDGNDKLFGTNAAEVFCGGNGNDVLRGKGGADSFIGGAGKDTVTYSERKAKQAVVVTLDGKANDGKARERDNLVSGIEVVIGGKGNDTITGDGKANLFKGGVGNDTLKGGGGADKLHGQKGKDKLDGGPKKDLCKTGEKYLRCEIR